MGQPKALLPFSDAPLLLILLRRLMSAFRHVYVVCSPTGVSLASDAVWKTLSDYCLTKALLVDHFPNAGPLGGIARAAEQTHRLGRHRYLVIPCDMPFLTPTFLWHLANACPSAPAVIPTTADGHPTGVCAAYHVTIQLVLADFLRRGGRRLRDFLQTIPAVPFPFSAYAHLPHADRLLYNLNTPDDYDQAQRWYQEINLEKSLSDDGQS